MPTDNTQNSDELHVNELLKYLLSRDRKEQLQYLHKNKMRRLENLQDQDQNVSPNIINLLKPKNNNDCSVAPQEISNLTKENKSELAKVLKDRQELRYERELRSHEYKESSYSSARPLEIISVVVISLSVVGISLSVIMMVIGMPALIALPFLTYIGSALLTISCAAFYYNYRDDSYLTLKSLDQRTEQYNQDKPKFQEIETKLNTIVADDKSVGVSQQNLSKIATQRKQSGGPNL